jgi:hypothetical protein
MKDLIERLKAWADPISSGYEVPRAGQALLEAADALERLTAENAALRKDAERYRWLRNKSVWHETSPWAVRWNDPDDTAKGESPCDGKNLDAAIDKAMREK